MNILSKPIKIKHIKFNSDKHKEAVWNRLRRNIMNDSIETFRLFTPDCHLTYRGEISSSQFKITRRNFGNKAIPTITGTIDYRGKLVLKLRFPLWIRIIKYYIWICLFSLAVQLFSAGGLTLSNIALSTFIIGAPAVIIIIMQRWLLNDTLWSEWRTLESILNEG